MAYWIITTNIGFLLTKRNIAKLYRVRLHKSCYDMFFRAILIIILNKLKF